MGDALLVMIYPRGKGISTRIRSIDRRTLCPCCRGVSGADLIKTNYTGDPASFAKIVAACSVPVFIAGGEKAGDRDTWSPSAMR